ncbi:hypothetical protein EVAR_20745_1 [Eumeta japonica]|uniref:Uncharacterized protein n=1 Tax=Eumeta variegata TaxID=151549 RepID=A0A4C1VAH3_EUMVA|nr:hypothetical protein EVAR_20745_1 [Eumeta japonica]
MIIKDINYKKENSAQPDGAACRARAACPVVDHVLTCRRATTHCWHRCARALDDLLVGAGRRAHRARIT